MGKITVVLPARNCKEQLARCLRALTAGTRGPADSSREPGSAELSRKSCAAYPSGEPAPAAVPALIVVDDASSDGTARMVREKWPSVTLLTLPAHTGYAHAANAGLRLVRTEYAFLLRPDLQPGRNCLPELLQTMREDPDESGSSIFCAVPVRAPAKAPEKVPAKASEMIQGKIPAEVSSKAPEKKPGKASEIIQGKMPAEMSSKAPGKVPAELPAKTSAKVPVKRTPPRTVDIVAAPDGCALYRMRVLEEIGWFDERHFDGLEAFDLSLRGALYGWRTVQVPGAAVRPWKHALPVHASLSEKTAPMGETCRTRKTGTRQASARQQAPDRREPGGQREEIPEAEERKRHAAMFRRQLAAGNAAYVFYKNLPFLQRLLGLPLYMAADAAQTAAFAEMGAADACRMARTRAKALRSLEQERRAAFKGGLSVYPETLSEASFLGMEETAGRIYPLFLAEKEPFMFSRIPRYMQIQRLLVREYAAWRNLLCFREPPGVRFSLNV